MASSDTRSHPSAPLNREQVERYLRQHPDLLRDALPDLLADHPDITYHTLAATLPERELGRNVVDFQAHSLKHLRQESEVLRVGLEEMMDTARANLWLQSCTHQAVLAVLRADSFTDLARIITDEVPALLRTDMAMLSFEPGLPKNAAVVVQEVPRSFIDSRLGADERFVLRPWVESEPMLYGSNAVGICSDALARLSFGEDLPEGLLVLGSRASENFYPEQGVELFGFFADVVEQCVRRCLCR